VASFTVRVELHDADDDDYASLHEAMEEQRFVRWIRDSDGNRKRLPTAEYNMADTPSRSLTHWHERAKSGKIPHTAQA
jgi:hypothetical protein